MALLVALAILAPSVHAGDARVHASAYRMDLGPIPPGGVREGTFLLRNAEDHAVDVHLLPEADDAWVHAPALVKLGPLQAEEVHFVYAVPTNATPGEHGDSLRIVAGDRPLGSATLSSASAIVFTSRTQAVGLSSIETPGLVLPGQAIDGALQVVNTWTREVNATVEVEWRDAGGLVRGTARLGPAPVPAASGARLAFHLPAADAAAGAQSITARVVEQDPADAPLAGASLHTFQLGRRSATHALLSVSDAGDGNATATVVLENTGDVPITLTPRVVVRDAEGVERVFLLDPVTLAPGEKREVTAVMLLPEGSFSVVSEADGADADVAPAALGTEGPLEFHMTAPQEELELLRLTAFALLAGLISLVVIVAWRRRARLRGAVAATAASFARAVPRPRRRDLYEELFASISDEPAPAPRVPAFRNASARAASPQRGGAAAFLLDLDGFGGDAVEAARLALFLADHDVQVAYAYGRASTPEAAARMQAELGAAGYTPRIGPAGADLRVQLAVDAMREAHAGRAVLLATHDAAYAPLVRAIQEDGGRVQALPVQRRVPVDGADAWTPAGPRARS